jgi:hypothetical protein
LLFALLPWLSRVNYRALPCQYSCRRNGDSRGVELSCALAGKSRVSTGALPPSVLVAAFPESVQLVPTHPPTHYGRLVSSARHRGWHRQRFRTRRCTKKEVQCSLPLSFGTYCREEEKRAVLVGKVFIWSKMLRRIKNRTRYGINYHDGGIVPSAAVLEEKGDFALRTS